MPEFTPGESKTARVPMTNPTAKAFDYTAELYMGVNLALMASVGFHLEAGESRDIDMPVVMPSEPGTYPVYIGVFSGGEFIPPVYQATEDVVIKPAVIGFTVTLINCPHHSVYGTAPRCFVDGTGTRVPCGDPGNWAVEYVPFDFSIDVYADLRAQPGVHPDWDYIMTYSFSATVEAGKDYIYDCATGEFADITVARKVRAYYKAPASGYPWGRYNGITYDGKRGVALDFFGASTTWLLGTTFIIPIDAVITQIEFDALYVYGYNHLDYRWTDQKPGEAEVIIAGGYVEPPPNMYTHYTIPLV